MSNADGQKFCLFGNAHIHFLGSVCGDGAIWWLYGGAAVGAVIHILWGQTIWHQLHATYNKDTNKNEIKRAAERPKSRRVVAKSGSSCGHFRWALAHW